MVNTVIHHAADGAHADIFNNFGSVGRLLSSAK